MSAPRILALAGSRRSGSLNARLLMLAAEVARRHGAEVDLFDWSDCELPLFDSDCTEPSPSPVNVLRQRLRASRGLLIASPEYNASLTPLLKNALDWASCPLAGESAYACFDGKVATLLSAAPGRQGGMRGLGHLRDVLASVGVTVLPGQFALVQAAQVIGERDRIEDPRLAAELDAVVGRLVEVLGWWQ
jgi:Predicted flavoprotein